MEGILRVVTGRKEEQFWNTLQNLFVGVPVEGESGYINLMRLKSQYFQYAMRPALQKFIDHELREFPEFREELFDKLYTFLNRYISKETGSIGFFFTPYHQSVYERVYTDTQDVMLFWKTQRLYYVKTDRLFRSMETEVDGFKFFFDASTLEHKKANEKRELVFEFKEIRQNDGALVFTMTYSERGRQTNLAETRRQIRDALGLTRFTDAVPSEATLERVFRVFERQSEVDYFLCKDAKSFLREQFDLWLWQYLLGKPCEEPDTEWTEARLKQLQALKRVAYRVIDYIAAFEDELVKIWNKPKFVLNSHYVITLDRIVAQAGGWAVLDKILEHPNFGQQLQEWRELGMVDEDFTVEDLLLAPSEPLDLFSIAEARGLITTGYHLPYNPDLVERARELRKHPTPAERKLWEELLRHYPYRVLRQRPIDHFIVDFYCPQLKLVIEVDGEQHYTDAGKQYDAERTRILESYGLRVIRFPNEMVMHRFDEVRARLIPPSPSPSPLTKGGRGAGDGGMEVASAPVEASQPSTATTAPTTSRETGAGDGGIEVASAPVEASQLSTATTAPTTNRETGAGDGGIEVASAPVEASAASPSPLSKGGRGVGDGGMEVASAPVEASAVSPSPLSKGGRGVGDGGINPHYQYLPIDTRYFKDLELQILALFDDLDESLDGWLIKSENYQALNTILPKWQGKVQCIYIDPPFNLSEKAEYDYEVNYKDSTWLTMLENRLVIAHEMMAGTGSIFVRVGHDGNMLVRMLLNSVFGHGNYRNEIIVRRAEESKGEFTKQFDNIKGLTVNYDNLYWYSKNAETRFPHIVKPASSKHARAQWHSFWKAENRPKLRYQLLEELPQKGQWMWEESRALRAVKNYQEYLEISQETGESLEDYWERTGRRLEFIKKEGSGIGSIKYWIPPRETVVVDNNWLDIKGYSNRWGFKTENSEHLLHRVVSITSPRDVCLDFFAGSGTTAAVAHKMRRRYIAIEVGNHYETVLVRRMKSVVYGEQSGISTETGWKGGGFFKYYELEQFEDTLRRTRYADDEPITFGDPLRYLFLRDAKLSDALQIEGDSVQVCLERLYPNIDLAETLSNLLGKPIRRIAPDPADPTRPAKVIFADGSEADLQNPDWKLVKPLIWW